MEKEQNVIPVNIDFNAKIHNRFDIEVHDAKTGELKQQAQAFNVICDALWTRLFNKQKWFSYIIYGRGTGTPSATDTTLFSKIGSSDEFYGGTINVDDSNDNASVISIRQSLTIGTETANGETITEVGIGYDATHIATHAMLQDMNGNPVSITKTNTDIIYIYATIYVHYESCTNTKSKLINNSAFYNTDSTGTSSKTNSIVSQGFISSLIIGTSFNTNLYFSQDNLFSNDPHSSTMTANASTKTFTYSLRCLVSENNYSRGILTILFANNSIILDTSKTFNLNNFAITGESLGSGDGSKTGFKTAFPINSSAKVYIDGIEQSTGVTVSTGVDKEFYKLRKIYNLNHNLIPAFKYLWVLPTSANGAYAVMIFENDENITFNGFYGYCTNSYGWAGFKVYGSDTFGSWTLIGEYSLNTGTINQQFSSSSNYRYYKFFFNGVQVAFRYFYLTSPNDKTYDVIFDTPPASGSVITIDYVPDCIPKDSNHVFDLTLSITLGEYSGN